MRVKIAGTLTTAQEAAINRAKSYHGKQPYQEFFADCVIWYKNGWAAIIPMPAAASRYYWEGGSNSTLTDLGYTPPTTFGSLGTITQPAVPYAGTAGVRNATANGTNSTLSYSNWVYDSTNPSPVLFYTPSSITLVEPAAFTNSLDPSFRWHWLNGACTIKDSDASIVSTTLTWSPVYPSYELLSNSAAWNAALLALHTAAIDALKAATPPVVSESPATSVTVTVGATSALAHASISASPTGVSSVEYDNFGNANLVIVTVPMTLTLVPDISGASDEVLIVDFYRDGEWFASSETDPFTYDIEILTPETASYSAIYTDASDEIDTAPLAVDGLLSRVDFYRGATLLASDVSPPYSCADPSLAVGEYTYSAIIYDDGGIPSAGEVAVTAVGPALTGDALSSITTVVPVTARPIDAEHTYERPYFDGTFYQAGGIVRVFPLSPMAGDERGMYFDQRLAGDLTHLKVEGYAKVRCGSATDPAEPFTIIEWVPLASATLELPSVGSTDFPMHIVYAPDAVTYGDYPIFGWWYDETEQIQKADMALDPAPTWQIALFNFVRDTMS